MPDLSLRSGISHQSFGDFAIVLDLERDRYWRIGGGAPFALDWICGRKAGPLRPDPIEHLHRMGLVEKSANPIGSQQSSLPPGVTSAIEWSGPPIRQRVADVIEVAARLILARLSLRRRRLHHLTAAVSDTRAICRRAPAGDIGTLARRFHGSRRLIPLAEQCLPDTLAFLRFAQRRGHSPRLVFGVVPTPFAAHCWAQSGDLILNDALGHTRSFTPILVI